MVRLANDPRYRSAMRRFIVAGSFQLLVGPASAASAEQMNVCSSTRATSVVAARAQNEFGFFFLVEGDEGSQPRRGLR
jgi:hypothetical protein